MTYKIKNHYGLVDDPRTFRSPLRALKASQKREGEGWQVIEIETGKRIELVSEGQWAYL